MMKSGDYVWGLWVWVGVVRPKNELNHIFMRLFMNLLKRNACVWSWTSVQCTHICFHTLFTHVWADVLTHFSTMRPSFYCRHFPRTFVMKDSLDSANVCPINSLFYIGSVHTFELKNIYFSLFTRYENGDRHIKIKPNCGACSWGLTKFLGDEQWDIWIFFTRDIMKEIFLFLLFFSVLMANDACY